ncbi:DUF3732 domain-containing protein, partial [Pseudomonas syringae pv. actinidiae]|nr:DUF3732 domain-containing protein [Pseudomonas syringae pv. actinidiae]
MLQHQNLVANKHAVFYRFDEKVKRDQAIDHFKTLMGIVDEAYFDIRKELTEVEYELRRVQHKIPKEDKLRKEIIKSFDDLLTRYSAQAGKPLFEMNSDEIYIKPKAALRQLLGTPVTVDGLSDNYEDTLKMLRGRKAKLVAEMREKIGRRNLVERSMERAQGIGDSFVALKTPRSNALDHTICPMCDSHTEIPDDQANKLTAAIDWLNDQMKLSPYAMEG